ncbi:hypothetical protein BDY19DRAFT_930330 [Irpex rosettiformis]|uniref:Uncharacterized protein n=1 Tax=Irpex rosettiformis TaxID=378272 RepID=A0ACB8UAS3_9APHY|nr:hypothetical protein BDY19DRAFT_930330 [Irpex rosettiformis]
MDTIGFRPDMALINKLPHELLAMIFLALRDSYTISMCQRDHQWYKNVYRWYSQTSLVCRLWREVSREYCMLWTVIEASLPERHFLMGMVKAAPLTVIYNPGPNTESPPFFEEYRSHVPRIKSLAMIGAHRWHEAFNNVQALPNLEELRLYRSACGHQDRMFSLPDLSTSFPALTTIDILGYRFHPHHSIFSHNIRSLRLGLNALERSVVRGLYQTTMAIVRKMPLLEHLGLHGVLTEYNPKADHPRITLPHLHCLSVSARPESCVALLSALKFPNDTHIDVKCVNATFADWVHVPGKFAALGRKLDGSDTLGDVHPIESLIVQSCPIVSKRTGMILVHCLKTQDPYGHSKHSAKNTAFFTQALTHLNHITNSTTNWREDKMIGVRLSLLGTCAPMVFADKWYSMYCHDWPLQSVKTCVVGHGFIALPEVRRFCPGTTTLFLEVGVKADVRSARFGGTPNDDKPEVTHATMASHTERAGIETITLWRPKVEKDTSRLALWLKFRKYTAYLFDAGIIGSATREVKLAYNIEPSALYAKGAIEIARIDLVTQSYGPFDRTELNGMMYV